jgi:hypothetical protein
LIRLISTDRCLSLLSLLPLSQLSAEFCVSDLSQLSAELCLFDISELSAKLYLFDRLRALYGALLLQSFSELSSKLIVVV